MIGRGLWILDFKRSYVNLYRLFKVFIVIVIVLGSVVAVIDVVYRFSWYKVYSLFGEIVLY